MIHDDCVYIDDHSMRLPGTLEVECRSCASFSFAWGRFSCEIIFRFGSYDNIWQDILGCEDLDATNADTLNFLSFLRLILFSCTAYIYVDIDIAVWLLFWQESREQQRNFEEHAKTQAKSCWQLGKCKWQDCMCKTCRSAVYLLKLSICCLWHC